ncbi:hypothetical protein [Chryseobacterium sp. JK1]|uniref:hypothetical protein n=1 Tax=Chryseobacterium sp. JK1 TaxID=874294 RepID=UPI003D680AE0
MKKIIYILATGIVTFSCSKNKKSEKSKIVITDTAAIDNVLLELVNNDGKGELRIKNNSKYKISGKIRVAAPCYFYRWDGNKIGDFKYSDINVDHTIVIVGNIINDDEKKYYDSYGINKIWGNKAQGIIFKNDSIILTNRIMFGHPVSTNNIGLDEKNFWDFAHNPNRCNK